LLFCKLHNSLIRLKKRRVFFIKAGQTNCHKEVECIGKKYRRSYKIVHSETIKLSNKVKMSTGNNSNSRITTTTMKLVEVAVSGTRLIGQDKHAEYEISINGTPSTWRRYREFDDLANTLKKTYPGAAIPNLPPKRLFGGNTPQVMAERRKGLETWLRTVTQGTSSKTSPQALMLREFLCADPWVEEVQNPPVLEAVLNHAQPSSKADGKLREIVNHFASSAALPCTLSLSRVQPSKSRDTDIPNEEFDILSFRTILENAENIFVVLRPTAL
jgi:hypothetical protein